MFGREKGGLGMVMGMGDVNTIRIERSARRGVSNDGGRGGFVMVGLSLGPRIS